jgi:hypothetical protein
MLYKYISRQQEFFYGIFVHFLSLFCFCFLFDQKSSYTNKNKSE